MPRFFIDRPVFAIVIAIIVMLVGVVSIMTLSIGQYPDIAPPTVSISATYPGASAETVENTVTQVIERELTGLDGLLYFSSSSSSDGSCSISLTFEQGTDPDIAQVQTQNKVQQVTTRLPAMVQRQGLTVRKSQSNMLMMAVVYDESGKDSNYDVADYLVSNVQDRLARLDGVGNVMLFGNQYAMRIWMDPLKLRSYSLMPSDLRAALEQQNKQASMGKLGEQPAAAVQNMTASVTATSLMETPGQFRDIIVKYKADGSVVRLRDVARVEMGSESYGTVTSLNNYPAAALAVQLASGANAMATSGKVRALMEEIKPSLPDGYKIAFANDNSDFVKLSIREVVETLIEAVILVVIVMYLFLGTWRATIIPALTVPVVLLGAFAVMLAFGFTINTLTLFGLVLSIGLLIDDTIVVVENVERVLTENKGMSPREATIESMKEISGALVGITAIIMVVFMPMIFFGGSTGIIYRQFSVTIIASMGLSVFMALSFTPAMCAILLRAHTGEDNFFQRIFNRLQSRYDRRVGRAVSRPVRWLAAYGLISGGAFLLLMNLSTGFLPNEDQGILICQYTLPHGAEMSRTNEVSAAVSKYFVEDEAANVSSILTTNGFGFNASGQNSGLAFITLKNWSERQGPENSAEGIAGRAMMRLSSSIRDANVFVLSPPPIMGLGQTDGFELYLLGSGGGDRAGLEKLLADFMGRASREPILSFLRADNAYTVPQLRLRFNNEKALSYGISLDDMYDTLNLAWAGEYVNDFIDRSRIKKVYLKSEADFRSKAEDLDAWSVRNEFGLMVPYSEFTAASWNPAPETLERFNGLPAYYIQGSASAGKSSGDAMDAVEKIIAEELTGASLAWSGLSYQEKAASGQTVLLYSISILVIFLCLAALYESWSIPVAVMLVIPLGVAGSVLAVYLRGLENNIYFQVALVTIIGLSARNAIMMVEFADQSHKSGMSLTQAARQAAVLRLRPILMTALTFGAGVLPLALSSGVGANSRIAIGTGTLGGTLTSTVLCIFLVPVFYLLVSRIFSTEKGTTSRTDRTTL